MAGDLHPLVALDPSSHVVVVGAGLAGWRLAQALRRDGFSGAISVVGDEPYQPYDRPPLSKQVLVGRIAVEATDLVRPGSSDDVTWRLGMAAVGLDAGRRTVFLADGTTITGTHVAVATGARARALESTAGTRVHTLRTRDDVGRLNGDLALAGADATVAVIGGGFIGAEVATSLTARGHRVIVLEGASRPLQAVLGDDVSTWLLGLPGDAGVELRTGQVVRDVEPDGARLRVRVEGGDDVVASVVVAGVGAVANTDWLTGSGLEIDNGVVVDEHLQAAEGVAAVGDVARFVWSGPTGRESVRIEHWQVANDHAAQLARLWTTGRPDLAPLVPYFWSDQYGRKVQLLGHPHRTDAVMRVFEDDAGRWLALYHRGGLVTGVVALNYPRGLMLAKPLLDAPTSLTRAVEHAPWRG